jgi:hypothetical protein
VTDKESYLDLQQSYQAYNKVTKLEIHTVLVLSRPYNQGTYGRGAGMALRPLTVWLVPCGTIQYRFEQLTFRQSCATPAEWLHQLTQGIIKSFDFVLCTSYSVCSSLNFVFDWTCLVMATLASANDKSSQLQADPGLLTPPSHVVTRGSFCCIPCHKSQGHLVSRNELRTLEEHGRAPHPAQSSATWQNHCSERYKWRGVRKTIFQVSTELHLLLIVTEVDCWLLSTECAGTFDDEEEDAWYVVAEYATVQRSSMDMVEIVKDIWKKAEKFMHQAGLYMQSRHIGKATSSISSNWKCTPKFCGAHSCVSMISFANVELESELPRPSTSWYSNSRAHMTRTATNHACLLLFKSEIHAVMEEEASKKQEDKRNFLEYSSNTQGDMAWHFRCWSYLTLPSPVQPLAATLQLWQCTGRQHSRQLLLHALGFLSRTLWGSIPRLRTTTSHSSW